MLLYTDVVNKALNREVLPLMQQIMNHAMTAEYGSDWYTAVGRDVLCKIRDFDRIEERIQGDPLHPIENMDLTSIFFLLSPYEEKNGEMVYLDGFMNTFTSFAGLEDWQVRKITRLRTIRNNVSHDRVDKDAPTDKDALLNGVNEKKWIEEIEAVLKFFKPETSLFNYQKQLMDDIGEMKKMQGSDVGEQTAYQPVQRNMYALRTEELRPEVKNVFRMDFMEGKIQNPMTEPAPWTKGNADLGRLPWPSKILKAEEEQRNRTTPPMSNAGGTSSGNEVDRFISDASNAVEKGINSLFGLFGSKK